MSAPMKKHPTNIKPRSPAQILYVVEGDRVYAIPKNVAKRYTLKTNPTISRPDNASADDVFAELGATSSKAATLLKGLRARENLSQVAFAKHIGISQANLSKMENGTRPIGKIIAKRIAEAFHVNYRYFLE